MMIQRKKRQQDKKSAQTLMEYVILVVVIMAALYSMQQYIQRGIQGKWKESLDGMDRQYDPRATIEKTHTMSLTAMTEMKTETTADGMLETFRFDTTNSQEHIDDMLQIGL